SDKWRLNRTILELKLSYHYFTKMGCISLNRTLVDLKPAILSPMSYMSERPESNPRGFETRHPVTYVRVGLDDWKHSFPRA
ncbi:hypothetical protein L0337_16230, partial [candidate division KSB1 bacterium]|nr:hypothetical protein [candidate division KSB1 bacterium]